MNGEGKYLWLVKVKLQLALRLVYTYTYSSDFISHCFKFILSLLCKRL